jgi:hypothetical protein
MSASLTFLQNSFVGGLNQQIDGSRLQSNEYGLLVNGRSRFDTIEQITNPVNVTASGWTKVQGGYAAGTFLLVFADGKAYYRDFGAASSVFTEIVGFQMSSTVDVIYACLVPSSTINGIRKLDAALKSVEGPILLTGNSTPSPQAIIVQDGINQPWIIFPNGTARVSQNYNQWTVDNREYIPMGKQMLWHDGILYIVSVDGLQIYRSVTGRPMDFMVIIKSDANKEASETDGGAAAISHKVDYSPITAIGTLNSPEGDFYVSTARTSYSIRPTFDITPYGEPYFSNFSLFTTGAVNQFSLCDILGDYAVIDYSGIRSFNAVQQFRIEGRNAPFSSKISKLLAGIRQESPASITFDNYGLFSVETVFGQAIMVFDTLTRQWTSLDLFDELKYVTIKMFAEVKTSSTRRLFAITDNNVYELYAEYGPVAQVGYYSPEFSSTDPGICHKPVLVQMSFLDVLTNGSCYLTLLSDEQAGTRMRRPVGFVNAPVAYAYPPLTSRNSDKTREVSFYVFDSARTSWKTGLYVQWSFTGKLGSIKMIANPEQIPVSMQQQMATDNLSVIAISVMASEPGGTVNIFGTGLAGSLTGSAGSLTCLRINGTEISAYTVISDNWIQVTLPSTWTSGEPVITVEVCTESETFAFSMLSSSVALSDNPDYSRYYTSPEVVNNAGENAYDVISAGLRNAAENASASSAPTDPVANSGPQTVPSPAPATTSSSNSICTNTLGTSAIQSGRPVTIPMVLGGTSTPTSATGYLVDVSSMIPLAERTHVVDGVTIVARIEFLFQTNSDGSFTFLGAFTNELPYDFAASLAVNTPNGLRVLSNDYSNISFRGRSFCMLNNGSSVPEPAPEPDPCDSSYPDTINIELAAMSVDTGAASMNDPFVTLTKTNVGGLIRYSGYGGDFTFTGLGGFHTNATILYRKDYPGYESSWVLDVTFDTVPAGSANGIGVVEAELIDACNPPDLAYPVSPIGHITGSLDVVYITIS